MDQKFRERKFRFSVISLGAVSTAVVVILSEVFSPRSVRLFSLPEYAVGYVSILAGMWFFFFVLRHLYPTYAGPDGLRSYDGIGRYIDVPWNDIQKVSAIVGYLWIRHGKLGRALCVPKFLEDWNGFRGYVLDHAPEGNPLRSYLANS